MISKLDNESEMYYRRLLLSKMDLYISSMKDDNNLTLVNKDYSLIKYSTDLDMIISNVITLLDTKSEVKEMCDLRNEISSMISDELEGNTLTLKKIDLTYCTKYGIILISKGYNMRKNKRYSIVIKLE